ncbi:MAG: DsbA family protein [Gemmatimonadaceae bacterium]
MTILRSASDTTLGAIMVVVFISACERRTAAGPAADSLPIKVEAPGYSLPDPRPNPADTAAASVTRTSPVPSRRSPTSRSETAVVPAIAPWDSQARPTTPRKVFVGTEDLTGIGYDRGSPTAPVIMVEFSDFACPYCAEFTRKTFPAIDQEFIKTGKVFFKYVPFVAGSFRNSAEATRAAECVGEQGAFWLMADRLSETQSGWKMRGSPDALLRRVARSTKVDSARYAACYADRHTESRTRNATDIANRVGVWVTPSFVVNGQPVQGALPLVEFRKVIIRAIAATRQP